MITRIAPRPQPAARPAPAPREAAAPSRRNSFLEVFGAGAPPRAPQTSAAPRETAAPNRRNSFLEVFGAGAPPRTPQASATTREAAAPTRRNSFLEVFGAGAPPRAPQTSAAPRETAATVKEATHPQSPPPSTTSTVRASQSSTIDTSWFRPSAPASLEALHRALEQAGLNPAQFQFEQIEADGTFPGRPDLSYVTHQLLIRGPNGVGLFDRDLALRTPWVTAIELRSYGIA